MNTQHCMKTLSARSFRKAANPPCEVGDLQDNGRNANLLLLISDDAEPLGIRFSRFLFDGSGRVVGRFPSRQHTAFEV